MPGDHEKALTLASSYLVSIKCAHCCCYLAPPARALPPAEAASCLHLQLGDNSTAAAEKGAVEEVQRSEKRVGRGMQRLLAPRVCCEECLKLVPQQALRLFDASPTTASGTSLFQASSGFASASAAMSDIQTAFGNRSESGEGRSGRQGGSAPRLTPRSDCPVKSAAESPGLYASCEVR